MHLGFNITRRILLTLMCVFCTLALEECFGKFRFKFNLFSNDYYEVKLAFIKNISLYIEYILGLS